MRITLRTQIEALMQIADFGRTEIYNSEGGSLQLGGRLTRGGKFASCSNANPAL
jgi:hypothetical protein